MDFISLHFPFQFALNLKSYGQTFERKPKNDPPQLPALMFCFFKFWNKTSKNMYEMNLAFCFVFVFRFCPMFAFKYTFFYFLFVHLQRFVFSITCKFTLFCLLILISVRLFFILNAVVCFLPLNIDFPQFYTYTFVCFVFLLAQF